MDKRDLFYYLGKQLNYFFPDKYEFMGMDIEKAFDLSLDRLENCFTYISLPGYSDDKGQTFFSHLHSDQYATFLYFFMNSLWNESENNPICNKVMYLNRSLHNFFLSYKCCLPNIFCLQHPVGTVLGNAKYNDYLVVLQNITVNTGIGQNEELSPFLGKGLYLGAGAKIIGNKPIGDRCSIGVNAIVYKQEVENDSNVIVDSKNGGYIIVKREKKECTAQLFFNVPIE